MGIDVYLRWDGQTEAERNAQYCGFSVRHGNVGYLREAYHGGPYATHALVPEGWEYEPNEDTPENEVGVPIPAAVLRERLPAVLDAAIERGTTVYKQTRDEAARDAKAFADFVELAERKERETGKPCWVYVSY